MSIAKYPSIVTLPVVDKPYPSIIEFLTERFPRLDASQWPARLAAGKLMFEDGSAIDADTPYQPLLRLNYYREVENEPQIPFDHHILYQDENIIIADKPHFLSVHPGGCFVNECLLYRLREQTGFDELAPCHRIDRETAGLVMFTVTKAARGKYQVLFERNLLDKSYEALARVPDGLAEKQWRIDNRIVAGDPWFRAKIVEGEVNARSEINLLDVEAGIGRFQLKPITGKKHQLRVHMASIGLPLLNDKFYPILQDEDLHDFSSPLKLLAKSLAFKDPLTGEEHRFESEFSLR